MEIHRDGIALSGDSALDFGISNLTTKTLGSGTYIYGSNGPNGGIVVGKLSDGGVMQIFDTQHLPDNLTLSQLGFFDLLDIDGQPRAVFGMSGSNSLLNYRIGGNGSIGDIEHDINLVVGTRHIQSVVECDVLETQVVFVADAGTDLISSYVLEGGSHKLSQTVGKVSELSKLEIAQVGVSKFLISSNPADDTITAFRIASDGALVQVSEIGASNGLGISSPSTLEIIETMHGTFVLVGAADTGSITLLRLSDDGLLVPMDHIVDTRMTRFDGVQDIASVTYHDWTFVFSGGSDDGLSMFVLLPSQKLLHLQTLVHETGLGLANISSIEAVVVGAEVQVLVTSSETGGITQFSVPLTELTQNLSLGNGTDQNDILIAEDLDALTMSGGAGDDILVAGPGNFQMTGGQGNDVFVIGYHSQHVQIMDFNVEADRVDLSTFPMLYDPRQLDFVSLSNGIQLSFGTSTISIYSDDSSSLTIQDIFGAQFNWANHLTVVAEDGFNDGDDTILGGAGPEALLGGAGNDILVGGGGDDFLDGGSGVDTAKYSGKFADYLLFADGDNLYVTANSGEEGSDTITNVELLSFADAEVSVAQVVQFDAYAYIASYADLRAVFGSNAEAGTAHFLQFGLQEGRKVSFSASEYIASYEDLRGAFGANISLGAPHFIDYGASEGRSVTFDALEYIASYADLTAVFGANVDAGATHFINYGAAEGRVSTFNSLEYLASYSDLRSVFGTDAEAAVRHYIDRGFGEGRKSSFDGLIYLGAHFDLITHFDADAQAATLHYLQYGANEGRSTNLRSSFDPLTSKVVGGGGADHLHGSLESEVIAGYDGNDKLLGAGGDDVLIGGQGHDLLDGGAGNDVLKGGVGADTFIFSDQFGEDTLLDFDARDSNERIDLRGVGSIESYSDLVSNHLSVINGQVTLTDGANILTLAGVSLLDLDVSDFIF